MQIVFVDTPGIHKPRNEFGKMMNSSAWDSIRDVEAILFLKTNVAREFFLLLEDCFPKNHKFARIINKNTANLQIGKNSALDNK